MRIATFVLNGQRQVGVVDVDGKTVTPLALNADQTLRGAQVLIDQQVSGQEAPGVKGQPVQLGDVQLEADSSLACAW